MTCLIRAHPLVVAVAIASLWLLAGFSLIDQRWRFPYDDGSWGTVYFFGQALANLILLPGFSVADALAPTLGPLPRWLIAALVSELLAALIDWAVRARLANRPVAS